MGCCGTQKDIEEPIRTLKEKGLRVTEPRRAIIQVLAVADRPMSAEDIFLEVKQSHPCDLATVYRNMEACTDAGILQKCMLENGKLLYELTNGKDHHHHIICRKCERTERIDLCLGEEMEEYGRKLGFSEVGHVLELYGICADCQGNTKSKKE